MDPHAARRARQKAIRSDLAQVYTDEEASPPEWVDLLAQVRQTGAELRDLIARETERFVSDPDIRQAIVRRQRVADTVRERVAAANSRVGRLNLLAPHPRFTRAMFDADELLRPLYRTKRGPGAG